MNLEEKTRTHWREDPTTDFACIDHFLKQRLQVVVSEMRDAWSGFDADDLVKSIM